jgi:hypothetical protein
MSRGRTTEARVLNHYPEIRQAVLASPEFATWRRGLKELVVDGKTLYLRGGDMLRDEDQVMFEWARKNGLLTDAAIRAAMAGGADQGEGSQ